MDSKIVISKKYKTSRNKYFKYSLGTGVLYSVSYGLNEGSFDYDEKKGALDFVLASEKVDSSEQLLDVESIFFQTMVDKIFGRNTVRLTKVVENDGSERGKLTECVIEDGEVTEYGVVGRTNKVFVDPGLADIAYYVVTAHNNKVGRIKKEVKQYKKINGGI